MESVCSWAYDRAVLRRFCIRNAELKRRCLNSVNGFDFYGFFVTRNLQSLIQICTNLTSNGSE